MLRSGATGLACEPSNVYLREAFANGTLVRPNFQQPDLVHLVRAVAILSGTSDMERWGPTQDLVRKIGSAHHIVFVLLDGLGMNLYRLLPPDGFLPRHFSGQIHAACPSTTASALTSIATGKWTNEHAVTGWFTYLPEPGITATILPFVERFSHRPLGEWKIGPEQVFPAPAFNPRMKHRSLTFLPASIVNTTYAAYSRGHTEGIGYTSLPQAVDLITDKLSQIQEPTHVHLYVPDIDTAAHRAGWDHASVRALAMHCDAEMGRLAEGLAARARLVVTADHGLINVPKSDQTLLFDGDPLLEMLLAPPSGDARMPIFHVRSDRREEFVEMFDERFGERIALVPSDEAERLQLFGPEPFSPTARGRLGDFIGIPFRPVTLAYFPAGKSPGTLYYAQHAGLSRDEMLVPVFLA